jgi:hypothetical protein
MIKTTNINDYISLQVLKNYCYSHREDDCKNCAIDPVCKCMSKIPADWNLEHSSVNEGDSK